MAFVAYPIPSRCGNVSSNRTTIHRVFLEISSIPWWTMVQLGYQIHIILNYIYIYVYIYYIYIVYIYIYTYIAILETPVSPLRSLLVSSRTRWCVVSSVVIPKLHVGMLGGCCDGADVENEHIFFSLSEVVEGFFVLTRMFRLVHCDKIRLYDN